MLERIEKIELLDVTKLTEGDRVIFSVDVGNMPAHKISEYFESVRNVARDIIPEPIQVVIKPSQVDITINQD